MEDTKIFKKKEIKEKGFSFLKESLIKNEFLKIICFERKIKNLKIRKLYRRRRM
jgi:hypothetical protein